MTATDFGFPDTSRLKDHMLSDAIIGRGGIGLGIKEIEKKELQERLQDAQSRLVNMLERLETEHPEFINEDEDLKKYWEDYKEKKRAKELEYSRELLKAEKEAEALFSLMAEYTKLIFETNLTPEDNEYFRQKLGEIKIKYEILRVRFPELPNKFRLPHEAPEDHKEAQE
jgi:hypothetical protein